LYQSVNNDKPVNSLQKIPANHDCKFETAKEKRTNDD